jgi:hypothetical protein
VHDKEQKLDEAQTEIDQLKHQQEEITQQAPPGDESSAAPTND